MRWKRGGAAAGRQAHTGTSNPDADTDQAPPAKRGSTGAPPPHQ
jgi:hypothetical protein